MFVRKKVTSSGAVKHYLVESRRVDGKVRQKVLYYLGKYATVEEYLEHLAWNENCRRETAAYYRAKIDAVAAGLDVNSDDYPFHDLCGHDPAHLNKLAARAEREANEYAAEAAKVRGIVGSTQNVQVRHGHYTSEGM